MVQTDGIAVYPGYSIRVVATSQTNFGVCIDVTYKYVATFPLLAHLPQEGIRKYKGFRYVYRFDIGWYLIQVLDGFPFAGGEHRRAKTSGKEGSQGRLTVRFRTNVAFGPDGLSRPSGATAGAQQRATFVWPATLSWITRAGHRGTIGIWPLPERSRIGRSLTQGSGSPRGSAAFRRRHQSAF